MSTAGGFSLPTASALSQSNIALTRNLWLLFVEIKKLERIFLAPFAEVLFLFNQSNDS